MKLSKNDLQGTGKVFCFTLQTYIKSKSNIVSFIIFIVMALLSVPIFAIFSGGKAVQTAESCVENIYISDRSALGADFSVLALQFPDAQVIMLGEGESCETVVCDISVEITRNADGSINIDAATAADTDVTAQDIDTILYMAQYALENAKIANASASSGDIEKLMLASVPVSSSVVTEKELRRSSEIGFGTKFAVQYIYSIFVMILSNLAAAHISRAIVEEKASKLVELLMVSVRPLALILGKILAMMIYIFSMVICMICAFVISYFVTGMFIDVSGMYSVLSSFGFNAAALNFSAATVFIVLISLLLGYLTFSIISGISGACCSTMEDIQYAQLSTVLIIITGYIISCMMPIFELSAMDIIFSFIPIVSIFCAPVMYTLGSISMGMLCVSWLVQAVVIVLLALFCARVYSDLLIHRGSRVKFAALLSIARKNGKERA